MAFASAPAKPLGYYPRSWEHQMEVVTTDPLLGDTLPAASNKDRPINALSTIAVEEVWRSCLSSGRLKQVTVVTGGQPPVKAWASFFGAGAAKSADRRGTGQANIPKGGTAWREALVSFPTLC